MRIQSFDSFNPRIKRKENERPYKIHVKYSHGDADFTTNETFSFTNEDSFDRVAHFFYDIMNFKPNAGHFDPLPNKVNAGGNEREITSKIEDFAKKWGISSYEDYIQRDKHYNQGYASLRGIKATINGIPLVFVFKEALKTNLISLPSIGDEINVSVNEIPGYGPKIFGGSWSDYLPNSGKKDYQIYNFKAKVIDCAINFHHDEENKYYSEYTSFDYILLLETQEDVINAGNKYKGVKKLVYQMRGWDPDFETKFNKDKYDGLNYYEVD